MAIYEKPTKELMLEFAATLQPGQVFRRQDAVAWFAEHYPKIQPNTVGLHVAGMSVNNPALRRHHSNIRPGSGHDLFFKQGTAQYRLWNPESDPAPVYPSMEASASTELHEPAEPLDADERESGGSEKEFAFERDLKNYLARNLHAIEQGMRLYQDEGFSGIEYPVGGRFIDILAVDARETLVVVELKVSRGYDRTIGQLLRYMAWVKENLASNKQVRGFIIAREISDDLRMAASLTRDVQLMEYELSLALKAVPVAR